MQNIAWDGKNCYREVRSTFESYWTLGYVSDSWSFVQHTFFEAYAMEIHNPELVNISRAALATRANNVADVS